MLRVYYFRVFFTITKSRAFAVLVALGVLFVKKLKIIYYIHAFFTVYTQCHILYLQIRLHPACPIVLLYNRSVIRFVQIKLT